MEPNLELMSQLEELNAAVVMEIRNLGLTASFNGDYCSHHYMCSFPDHLLGSLPVADQCQAQAAIPQPIAPASVAELAQGDRKRKRKSVVQAHDALSSQRSSAAVRSEPLLEQADVKKNKNSPGKRATGKAKEVEKPKQVVHVRTSRGQATDSHSLAERSRRERINQRMRSLQDLVPGCYKTMGMAGMLDEIINYVQSLHNQVEFLSLKLSAASAINGCFFDMEAVTAPQGGSKHDAAYGS